MDTGGGHGAKKILEDRAGTAAKVQIHQGAEAAFFNGFNSLFDT